MNVIVLGDVMIDVNYYCTTNRRAPEADIPVYRVIKTDYILGGAANVAKNLKNLNCNITMVSVVGNDIMGGKIIDLFNKYNINNKIFIDNMRNTTQKNRLFYNNDIVTRYDVEDTFDINNMIENEIFDYIVSLKDINAVIISDYDKGIISLSLCTRIIEYMNKNNIYTFVDPKIKNYRKYINCFCFKPNLHEAMTISKSSDLTNIFNYIFENIKCTNLILTDGGNGMYLNSPTNIIKHNKIINLIDVTGAGDTVLCVLVYIYLKEKNMQLATNIANYIGGISVQVIGNYNIEIDDIDRYYIDNNKMNGKLIYDYMIDNICNIKKLSEDKKIVFTNGCFDIIHSAHLKLLKFAKSQGDILVVGLNSDESIRTLKGPSRPINDVNERSELLANLDIVDYIVVFDEMTPLNIIKLLKPNILVKGSDYNKDNVIGKEYVDEVILFDFIKNKSSSIVINKIKTNLIS